MSAEGTDGRALDVSRPNDTASSSSAPHATAELRPAAEHLAATRRLPQSS